MKKYYCDICGKEITTYNILNRYTLTMYLDPLERNPKVENFDVCDDCKQQVKTVYEAKQLDIFNLIKK